jgi:hypothetical protein
MAKKIYNTKMNFFNQAKGIAELRDVKLVAGEKVADIDVPLDCYECAHHADDINGLVWPIQSRLASITNGRASVEKGVVTSTSGDYFIIEPVEELRDEKQYLGFKIFKAEKA